MSTPADRFKKQAPGFTLNVPLDTENYKHFQVTSKDDPFYWFDLIFSPRLLTVRSGMGTFSFSVAEDMLNFFYISRGPKPDYWSEKVISSAGDQGVLYYDPDWFLQEVEKEALEVLAIADEDDDEEKEAKQNLLAEVCDHFCDEPPYSENEAFSRLYSSPVNLPKLTDMDNLRTYSSHYLWVCEAIAWAVERYYTSETGRSAMKDRKALKEAVKYLEEVSQKATTGPWTIYDAGDATFNSTNDKGWWWVWQESALPHYGGVGQMENGGAVTSTGITDNEDGQQELQDATHIALWNPLTVQHLIAALRAGLRTTNLDPELVKFAQHVLKTRHRFNAYLEDHVFTPADWTSQTRNATEE